MKKVLRVEKLRKSYGNKVAVKDIDFEVNKGEIFALLGPNGAGKTTTLKCILGLRKKDSGKIEIKGKYAYLPEKKELYRYYTVKKMVEITNYYTEGFDKRKAFDLLSDFQIDLNEKIANLSHGMVTQVYLALLLSQDADIYILDEPTWGLDPVMRNRIIENIRELSYEGKAVLYTSHILAEVEKVADKVAIMSKGQILEMDHLDSLKEKYVAIAVKKGERVDGYKWKETENEVIYIVKKENAGSDYEHISFDTIFEAIVRRDKE